MEYPKARVSDQVDDYFGTKVRDPYRWMENVDSGEVKTWVDAENQLTRSYLDDVPGREKMHARLMDLTNFERYTPPERKGERYFYAHNTGLQNQNVVFWQEGLKGEPKVLLDPNTMSKDGTVALNALSITEDGRLAAYSIADAGSDWVKWHVREVATGKDLPDLIEWSKFSGASWTKDGSGFFYEGYERIPTKSPAPKTRHRSRISQLLSQESTSTNSERRSWRTSSSSNGLTTRNLNVGASVTDDGRYLLLIFQSQAAPAPTTSSAIKEPRPPRLGRSSKIVTTRRGRVYAPDRQTTAANFWLRTTLDAQERQGNRRSTLRIRTGRAGRPSSLRPKTISTARP